MWKNLKIDVVSPPFAGHLYPLLELARGLRQQGLKNLRVLSTPEAASAIQISALEGVYFLADESAAITAIANPPYRVKNNPWRLLQQFRANLSLMQTLRVQLRSVWQLEKPDLVIVDFTLPIAGHLAQEMGIAWWTSTPTLCAIETQIGTPSYLGGLMPGSSPYHRGRDWLGRRLIRGFKLAIGYGFRPELQALNFPSVYRTDGYERIYSPEKILGLGMREFEFERDWPPSLEFIGPLTASPPFPHRPPTFQAGVRHVLVSLGTHIPWAKGQASQFVQQVAAQMPTVHFHFSYGQSNYKTDGPSDDKFDHKFNHKFDSKGGESQPQNNLFYYDYLPYDHYLPHCDAAIIHGGTGVLYSCIRAGVPMLVWPHDYDQFDHAARIVDRGLGLRLKPDLNHTVQRLHRLFSDPKIACQMRDFQTRCHQYDPVVAVMALIQQWAEGGLGV